MRVRRRHRLRRIVAWSAVVLLASLAGGLCFAWVYATDSDTLVRLIRAGAPRYLPGAHVYVSKARVRPFAGEVHLNHLSVRQMIDGAEFETVKIPWLSLRHNTRAALEGRFEPTEMHVAQPTLRLCHRKDGSWNLQGLLADPWPGPPMKTPPIQISNGTVELVLSDGAGAGNVAGPGNGAGGGRAPASAILRDVNVRLEPAGPGKLTFDGTAKGDTFDRLALQGIVEIATGRVDLRGDVARLAVSEPLRGRLPADLRPAVKQLGLTAGEVDLKIARVAVRPGAEPRVRYDVSGRLSGGVLSCPKLPFSINDLSAGFTLRDGVLTLERAEGFNGKTTVRVESGTFPLDDPERGPFALELGLKDLPLDARLRRWLPAEFAKVWDGFKPGGWVDLKVSAGREEQDGPLRRKVVVDCRDVSLTYEHFRYPLDHVSGQFVWEGDRVDVLGLRTVIGGRPLLAGGTIDDPGPGAVVKLTFAGQALPIDKTLLDALPADVRQVVDQFQPTGTVRGKAEVTRLPPEKPGDDPRGRVRVNAVLDLNERCGIKWEGLPYPVNNLTGRLEIHPDLWEFKDMRGVNGQAVITGTGKVEKLPGKAPDGGDRLKVDLRLNAEKLPFDEQLRAALPPAWRKSWAYLDPTGSSDVDATIRVHPGEPDRYHLVIVPRPATDVRLRYTRAPKPGLDPGGTFELRLEDVTGRFVFDNGPVEMHDVAFQFHGSPVQFGRGRVVVDDTGKFLLGVRDLWVRDIRLDTRIRAYMPPVMAQFAQKLDDGRTFTLKGHLGLGWPGGNAPVWCRWDDALVVFNDNSVQLQPGLGLEHMQGQFDHVRGWTDGETFDLHGALVLESVALLGQQITRLESPVDVGQGYARLESLRGQLLGGELTGRVGVSLDATPRYEASLAVSGADLQQYAKTLPGRQTFRGLVRAQLDLKGFGGDPRTLQGTGEAHVLDGNLGELPVFLKLFNYLQLSSAARAAFDSADLGLTVQNGKTYLDPVRLTGTPFSLLGRGTMDVQGDLDLRLRVIYGRDRVHIRGLSDLLREASGQFVSVRVLGTPSFPKFKLEALPGPAEAFKSLGQRRVERDREGAEGGRR
jgi:hypothetical protein